MFWESSPNEGGSPSRAQMARRIMTDRFTKNSNRDSSDPSPTTDPLTRYLSELSRHSVMTPEEERRRAQEIAELRAGYWRALLSHPPSVAPIVAFARQGELLEPVDDALFDRAVRTARRLRDRDTRANLKAYEAAVAELAAAMAYADPECKIADPVRRDLERLARGERPETLEMRRPPRASGRFAAYLGRVRLAHQRLCRAREAFVRANLRLVVKMALRYRGGLLPLPDLVQEGNLGLMKAVDRFDVRKGFRFSTYASWWIRHAMTRAAVNTGRTIRIPAHLDTSHAKIAKARRKLAGCLGRSPTLREVAAETGLTPEQVADAEEAVRARTLSMETSQSDETRTPLRDLLPDPEGNPTPDRLEDEAVARKLHEAMEDLSPIEVDILTKRFGLEGEREHTLAEVGRTHRLSRERIRQIQNQALAKVRAYLELQGIEG